MKTQSKPAAVTTALLVLCCWVAASTVHAQVPNVYWTGGAVDDDRWSSAANWFCITTGTARVPDTTNDVIGLGFATYVWDGVTNDIPNVAQNIFMDIDDEVVYWNPRAGEYQSLNGIRIDAFVLEPTGQRQVHLTATNGAVVGLVNQSMLTMNAVADAHAILDMELVGAGGHGSHDLRVEAGPARLIFEKNAYWNARDTDMRGGGTLELRGPAAHGYDATAFSHDFRTRAPAGVIVLATEGQPFCHTNFDNVTSGVELHLKTDSGTRTHIRGQNDYALRIIESGDSNRLFTVGSNVRGSSDQVVSLLPPPEGDTSSGHLTVSIGSTWAANSMSFDTYEDSTILIRGSSTMNYAPNDGISGMGHLLMEGDTSARVFTVTGRAMTYQGRTMISTGIVALASHDVHNGQLPQGTIVELGEQGTLRLNGIDQTLGGLTGFAGRFEPVQATAAAGTVELGGAALTIDAAGMATAFSGGITGTGALVKAGAETFTLMGGYTNAAGRTLRVAGGLLEVTGALDVEQGSFEIAGGRLEAETLVAGGMTWDVTLAAGQEAEGYHLVSAVSAVITDGQLVLRLAEGFEPELETQFTLLRVSGTITGDAGGRWFGFEDGAEIAGTDGSLFRLDFSGGSEQLVLTVIPEPGSLALLTLALLGLAARRLQRGRAVHRL